MEPVGTMNNIRNRADEIIFNEHIYCGGNFDRCKTGGYFLDESGVNADLTRLYGRTPSSQRAVDHTPLHTPQTTTILSSIRFHGEKAFTTYQGGTTGERFVQYLKKSLTSRKKCLAEP